MAATKIRNVDPLTAIQIRKEVVLELVKIEGFVQLDTTQQIEIFDTFINYILTGEKGITE